MTPNHLNLRESCGSFIELLDYSVYPDLDELPDSLDTSEDKADYVARICGAWDFGLVPTPETFLLFESWREIFDQFPLTSSPAYAAFRSWYGWPPIRGEHKILRAIYEIHDLRKSVPDPWIEQNWEVTVFEMNQEPKKPESLEKIAVDILDSLRQFPESSVIVLGGHFALKHYLDYRQTHDIDAWWDIESTLTLQEKALERIREVMQSIAAINKIEYNERKTKYIYSFEFKQNQKTFFSFQIAERERQLETPLQVIWSPIKIETLRDNAGEKMSAVVNRGAPRDFVDVRAIVESKLLSESELWALWQQKNPQLDIQEAKKSVLRNLESIELRRPISRVPAEQRETVQKSRQWFRENFLQLPKKRSRGMQP